MPLQRKRSWIDWDGCKPIAAWQPLYAPSYRDSLWNWRNGWAVSGIDPTFAPARGWTLNGTDQYLVSGVVPASGYSMLIRFTGWSGAGWLAGAYNGSGNNRLSLGNPNAPTRIEYGSGKTVEVDFGSAVTAGVLAVAGQQGYRDGVAVGGTIAAWDGVIVAPIEIGRLGGLGGGNTPFVMQGFAIYDTTLSPSQMWQRSHMLAHLENPDWSAWTPARRYYFAPSATAFNPAWARGTNQLIGGG